ncbi:hypothetical protein DCMF_13730 [Candidatus Formimonas warabiya]|uniref:ATP-grasp domain-containing protein n=1 Tax=Formimonas warabiya TaxID=1761012 RepID=A0A3G1L1T3_FORW1|nr:hypothetical protein DCMF_13730 [Candidatus Formimonas warabiya]
MEIYRAACNSIHFRLIGGSSTYDHGRFVYKNHIDGIPFITDSSDDSFINDFNAILEHYHIDYIYPSMDGVVYKLAEFSQRLAATLIAPDFFTTSVCRSKRKTYDLFKHILVVPKEYMSPDEVESFPVFLKPDVGQGSAGTQVARDMDQLKFYLKQNPSLMILEYLPGKEYTVDCFTNRAGRLVFVGGRDRKRIKSGISINATQAYHDQFFFVAEKINSLLHQKGGWFFQLKENARGELSLLEVAARIAGTSTFFRGKGINLPLLTMFTFNGQQIDDVLENKYDLELDRALYNRFRIDLKYSHVYLDYDDTVVIDGQVNPLMIAFIFQCLNEQIPVHLITKHEKDIQAELEQKRLTHLFDEIIHLQRSEEKYVRIQERDAIFIDDSYNERRKVFENKGIPVFDTHMLECLLK